MHVVQLLPDFNVGGVERGVVELSGALTRAGVTSTVLSRPGTLCDALAAGGGRHVPFECGGKNPLTALGRARRLREVLRQMAPDIVHVRSRVPAWLLRLAGGEFAVVSTFHGFYSVGRYSRIMTRAAVVICPSFAVREHIMRHYGLPAARLPVIHRGVDGGYFDAWRADANAVATLRRQWRLEGRTVFAMVARVTRLKGHALFLRAFAGWRARGGSADAVALIVGADGGRRCEALRQLADELGIGGAVRFVKTRQDMREVYAACDAVVSASLQPEAFGRTVAEALAMGLPVAAPAHGGALDIVRDGENGVLFAPGDVLALQGALGRVREATWDAAALRESVARFSLANMTARTMGVYRSVISDSNQLTGKICA